VLGHGEEAAAGQLLDVAGFLVVRGEDGQEGEVVPELTAGDEEDGAVGAREVLPGETGVAAGEIGGEDRGPGDFRRRGERPRGQERGED